MWVYLQNAVQAGTTRDDLIKGLSAGALGLLGTVVTIGVGWLKDRDASADRLRRLDEATKRVTFWSTWLAAIKLLDSGDDKRIWEERVRSELLLASGAVEILSRSEASEKAVAKNEDFVAWRRRLPWWRRWFLFYTPARRRAWFPRFLFYIYFFTSPIYLWMPIDENARANRTQAIYVARLADPSISPEMKSQYESLLEESRRRFPEGESEGVFPFIGCLLLVLFCRWWSVSAEKPKVPSGQS